MWVAKITHKNKENPIFKIVEKVGVRIYYYPLNYYVKGDRYYFITAGLIEGTEKQKKEFFREFKKLKKYSNKRRVLNHLEIKSDFFIAITSEKKSKESKEFVHFFYNPAFIHIKPNIIYPTFEEKEEIASPDRKVIEKMINIVEKNREGKLLGIQQKKIADIGILSVLPRLTTKQKEVFYLAIKKRYYGYPREIKLSELAKIMKISLSTYRAHLRKAEKKILPFIAEKIEKGAI